MPQLGAPRRRREAEELATPLGIARHLHDTVAQRLATVSFLLSCDEPLSPGQQAICQAQVSAALGELRETLQGVGNQPQPAQRRAAQELEALRRACPGAEVDVELGALVDEDDPGLTETFLVEALRNVRKHALPTRVTAGVEPGDGVTIVSVVNDGVRPRRGTSCGAGTHLLQLEAALLGALVESRELRAGWWQQRLILPLAG